MHYFRSVLTVGLMLCLAGTSQAGRRDNLNCINSKLKGKIIDFTNNHGSDNRFWSQALCQKRDMYVYVPPGYDPALSYGLGIYMHGAGQDEDAFVSDIVQHFDDAMASGKLPPFIIAAPDGTIQGELTLFRSASFWVNGRSGRFEDYVQQDIWNFLHENFRIRPDRESHALIGVSMGGTGAFGQAIKYRDRYKMVIGIMPAVNLRWVDSRGHYMSKFDPNNWGWRERMNPLEVIGRPRGPLNIPINIRAGILFRPIVGHGFNAIELLSSFNPIEYIDRYGLREGELSMYIGYAGCDEFNIDAQVDSFLYLARCRGIGVTSIFDPCGHHNTAEGLKMMPQILAWIAPQVPPPVLIENKQ